MAFNTDTLPSKRTFAARIEAALDAAVTGLAMCRNWSPPDPAKKDGLTKAFQQMRAAAMRADKILNNGERL